MAVFTIETDRRIVTMDYLSDLRKIICLQCESSKPLALQNNWTKVIRRIIHVRQAAKTAEISRRNSNSFPAKWSLGNELEIFHTDDVTYSGLLALLIGGSKFSTNQKHYQHLGSVEWTVRNFCACSSNIISWWNCWCRREMSAVFSGSTSDRWSVFKSVKTEEYNWSDSLLPEN